MRRQHLSVRSGSRLPIALVGTIASLVIGFAALVLTAQTAVVQSTSPIRGFADSLR